MTTLPSILVVAAHRPDVYAEALRSVTPFGVTGGVEVISDRRLRDRRQPGRPFDDASKRNDRRRIRIDEQLRSRGWAVVSAATRAAIPPHVPLSIDLGMSDSGDSTRRLDAGDQAGMRLGPEKS